ncbi:MAG: hypothetical protein SFW65_10680 [Alphaproteobacteria bacterium]|nr:hypothetical protein [Alphaproteobacteria bacterium]
MATKKTKTAKKNAPDFYARFFALVEKRGWFALTLPEIAKATGVSLSQLLETYGDKSEILTQFGKKLDVQLAHTAVSSDEPLKDKLFDVVMQRFDALAPYRAGLIRLVEDMQSHPISAVVLCLETVCGFTRSMALMFEIAGISTTNPRAVFGVVGLKIVYLSTLRTWKYDDSADLSATMATLDRGLTRLVSMLRFDR